MITSIHSILKKHWGYDNFRPLQQEIIQSVLEGNDTLALLPTGGGKSLCFQVPALVNEGICMVVTPLIALMKDQVESLQAKKIPALSIYTGMNYREIRNTLQQAAYGQYKFLYVSPERLESSLFREFLPALPLNLVAVDEAHCISQWGYDFRPAYLKIAGIREQKPNVPILALTASATADVQQDICDKLQFNSPLVFRQSFERANLSYSVIETDSRISKLTDILRKVPGSAIVYCKSRRRTKEMADLLNLEGMKASSYHAGLSQEERNAGQESWLSGKTPIMVCTNAFGMGIDKPDVRTVIHVDIPDCLENYYQEAGRAGRDGKKAYAILLYQQPDLEELERLSETRYPPLQAIREVYQALANYLQLPTGTGEDDFFDFDIGQFVKRFNLDIQQVIYSFQALQQEAIISFHEQVFLPSTVQVTASKDLLFEFERNHAPFEPLIKTLLRCYGGILDQPVAISEKQLAATLRTHLEELKSGLHKLHQQGILKYQPQKDNPQVRFLQNRVKAEDLHINTAQYQKRKQVFEQRVTTMIHYAKDLKDCRAVFIGEYFGDKKIRACGICDNCMRSKNGSMNREEFEIITARLRIILEEEPLTIKDLLHRIPNTEEKKLWKVIDYLAGEQKLIVGKDGKLSLK